MKSSIDCIHYQEMVPRHILFSIEHAWKKLFKQVNYRLRFTSLFWKKIYYDDGMFTYRSKMQKKSQTGQLELSVKLNASVYCRADLQVPGIVGMKFQVKGSFGMFTGIWSCWNWTNIVFILNLYAYIVVGSIKI